jgi:hypothetical protein
MKSRTLGAFAFASALAFASTPGQALTFNFSFTNTVVGGTSGTVTGQIVLPDNMLAVRMAEAVFINSVPSAFNFNLSMPVSVPLTTAFPNLFLSHLDLSLAQASMKPLSSPLAVFFSAISPLISPQHRQIHFCPQTSPPSPMLWALRLLLLCPSSMLALDCRV